MPTFVPFEASLELLLKIILAVIEGQPPEVRAELWRMHVEDLRAWRAFWAQLKPDSKS